MLFRSMGKEDMGNAVAIHAGLQQIHQGAGSEVEQEWLVGAEEIAGSSAGLVDVRAGPENRQMHRVLSHELIDHACHARG